MKNINLKLDKVKEWLKANRGNLPIYVIYITLAVFFLGISLYLTTNKELFLWVAIFICCCVSVIISNPKLFRPNKKP